VITNALRGFASLLGLALSMLALGLLSSCGGGDAATNPNLGAAVTIEPQNATFYAGVPATITVSGFHPPYSISSSEPGILPVPDVVNGNTFQVIPNNPGVVDVGLPAGALPVRTVTVTVHAGNGNEASTSIKVAQNFLTCYTSTITSPGCSTGTVAVAACAGQPGVITMSAVFNGSLQGGKQFRFCNVIGDFQFFDIPTNSFQNCIVVTADHEGRIIAPFRVTSGASGQLAIFRIQDVATGVFTDTVFVINAATAVPQSVLTVIPSTISFTGRNGQECGTGSADVFIFGGVAPFTAFNSDPRVTVQPRTTTTNPPRFTITVGSPVPPCLTNVPVTFTDATGAHVTVTVNTTLGTSPPAAPITVAPAAITLSSCGASGSVSVAGGSGNYSVSSSTSRIQALVQANTITITRIATGDTAPITTPQQIGVTDGATTQTVTVNLGAAALFCP